MKKIFVLAFLFSCGAEEKTIPVKQDVPIVAGTDSSVFKPLTDGSKVEMDSVLSGQEITASTVYEVKLTRNDTSGFGYEIYKEGKLYIRQPIIPAIPGNHAFSSEKDALKAGNYVVKKITKGIMPPSLTIDELKKLGVVK